MTHYPLYLAKTAGRPSSDQANKQKIINICILRKPAEQCSYIILPKQFSQLTDHFHRNLTENQQQLTTNG